MSQPGFVMEKNMNEGKKPSDKFYCYSYRLVCFIKAHGIEYIERGYNRNTQSDFWVFKRDERLNTALDNWSEFRDKMLNKREESKDAGNNVDGESKGN